MKPQHQSSFFFVSKTTIALAGGPSSACGIDAGLLKCFAIDGESERTFFPGPHDTSESVSANVGISGSSEPDYVGVHRHDDHGKISVMRSDLLAGILPVRPNPLNRDKNTLTRRPSPTQASKTKKTTPSSTPSALLMAVSSKRKSPRTYPVSRRIAFSSTQRTKTITAFIRSSISTLGVLRMSLGLILRVARRWLMPPKNKTRGFALLHVGIPCRTLPITRSVALNIYLVRR